MPISSVNQGFPAAHLQDEILAEVRGEMGILTLNRPGALNALSLEMIRTLAAALRRWELDNSIKTVFLQGAGGKAFSVGGDLKAFYNAGMDYRCGKVDERVPSLYFAEEYSLNAQIFHYTKPIVAFMNGITMGGGYGLAGHCRHRVATDHTVFAMPETKIGLFPDVGSVYQLLKCPGHAGWYLALTGNSIGPADMLYAGLADFFVPFSNRDGLIEKLSRGGDPSAILNSFQQKPPGESVLQKKSSDIERIFSLESIDEIVAALEQDGAEWVQAIYDQIIMRSPSSVAVTAAHLERARGKKFDAVLETDFTLVQHFVKRPDLYEGIRALILDKDNTPKWEPGMLENITPESVNEYFRPTGYSLKDVQIFRT